MSNSAQPVSAEAVAAPQASAASVKRAAHAGVVDVGSLVQTLDPLTPDTSILAVGERFLHAASSPWLSLPIVEHGRPIGSVSRYELMQQVYIKPFGRELHGRRPIRRMMHTRPLILASGTAIEDASRLIAARIRQPIMEDFIVVDEEGLYLGAGKVLDLLHAMELRASDHAAELGQAYRKLQSSQTQLIQSEKMASLGQMVAGLAHEINTPLGYVRNNVQMTRTALDELRGLVGSYELVIEAMTAGSDENELIQRIARLDTARSQLDASAIEDLCALLDDSTFGVDQIAELVANLKDFSRLDQARLEQVDIHELIERALKIGGNLLRKRNIDVVRQYADVPLIHCSPAQINQVLLNIITNAAQAIEHERGRITVRTHAVGHYLLVAIEDNGKGIAQANLERIFDPFFTTKPVGQGTGLGLSICFQIVEQHHGRIRATSTPGAGTRFLIALPLQREAKVST